MKHKRCELWVNDNTGEINCLLTEPLFGTIQGKLIPVWNDAEQWMMLNDGENRVEVVVYHKKLDLELIKQTVRYAISGAKSKW